MCVYIYVYSDISSTLYQYIAVGKYTHTSRKTQTSLVVISQYILILHKQFTYRNYRELSNIKIHLILVHQ